MQTIAWLKQSLGKRDFAAAYLFSGEESYMKEHYLSLLIDKVVGGVMPEFNVVRLQAGAFDEQELENAIESPPMGNDYRIIVVEDLDLYSASAHLRDYFVDKLNDLPGYSIIVFYYDLAEFKPDKRMKIHKIVDQVVTQVYFPFLKTAECTAWIQRRFCALGKTISRENCEKLQFFCGTAMTNLITEIEKLEAFAGGAEIAASDIDAVCAKQVPSIVFDLLDQVAAGRTGRAVATLRSLLDQRNDPIALCAAINHHVQKLYATKLAKGEVEAKRKALLRTNSTFYANKMLSATKPLSLSWLRDQVIAGAEVDLQLKSASLSPEILLEMLILSMGKERGARS